MGFPEGEWSRCTPPSDEERFASDSIQVYEDGQWKWVKDATGTRYLWLLSEEVWWDARDISSLS